MIELVSIQTPAVWLQQLGFFTNTLAGLLVQTWGSIPDVQNFTVTPNYMTMEHMTHLN